MRIIIVGAGEVGFHIAGHLSLENKNVVVVDTSEEALRRVSDACDVQIVQGSGSNPAVLETAGIQKAEIMLAVTNSDETNLVACLMADLIAPSIKKLARIRQTDFQAYQEHFRAQTPHIDTVINPEIEVVKTIERLMEVPGAVDVAEFGNGRVKFIGIRLEADTPLTGIPLQDLLRVTQLPAPLIVAIIRKEELIIPRGKDCLQTRDLIYFICEDAELPATLKRFNKQHKPFKRVLIVGGGPLGYLLAQRLEKTDRYVKIIDRNSERCHWLADTLNRTVVLCGDGSDQELLDEEHIQDMDVVITLTGDEETNILTSLLARRLGARQTITNINKFSYFPIMAAIGIEQVVSPRLSAINTILQHIRRGKILSAKTIKGEKAEVIEAEALETSEITGRPLKNITFPRGVLVAAIIHADQVVIPNGESVIQPGDHVIIFAHRKAIAGVEKILAVKREYF